MLTANLVKDVWTSVAEGLQADLDSRRKPDPGGSAPDPGDSAPDQSHKCADEVSFMPPNVDAMSEATIRKYQDQAHVMIDQSATLLVETSDGKTMVEMLRAAINRHESPVAAGTSMYDMGIYDVKLAGESVTHPHLRVCGFRSEHYMKMSLACVRALLPEGSDNLEEFADSGLLVLIDGGKRPGPARFFAL